MDEIDKKHAQELLDEHAQIKGSEGCTAWNIKARAFLVFMEIKKICGRNKSA